MSAAAVAIGIVAGKATWPVDLQLPPDSKPTKDIIYTE
jgi:hypothetical protein